jgi:hypothetical protein
MARYSDMIKARYEAGRRMKKLLKATVLILSGVVFLAVSPLTAIAATSTAATNGYRLSPVRTDLTIKPGSKAVVTVYITNASNAVENLEVVINDFQPPANETGNPALLLNGATAPQHSLKQFVPTVPAAFTLQPKEQKAASVTITVPAGTTSGGYYGAIRFVPAGTGGSKNVNLSASVASLVLITVPGDLHEQLAISSFGIAQGNTSSTGTLFFNNKNLKAVVRFHNSGNVQVQPFGKVLLKKGSNTLETQAVNNTDTPGNVLPDSTRAFNVKLTKVGWFGKYKAQGNFGYGSGGQLLSAQATFYVIPMTIILIIVLLILLILFVIFGVPRVIRGHDRRVLARVNRRK